MTVYDITQRPLRSVLYAPADKQRVIAKIQMLHTDCVIFDLEDAVAPGNKEHAREALRAHFRAYPTSSAYRVIRINALDTPWGTEDLMAARACMPDAILVPKVSVSSDVTNILAALAETDAPDTIRVWAMIETTRGVANAANIAQTIGNQCTRLDCFVIGTNDLFKQAGIAGPQARTIAHPWLMQIVLAAKAGGLQIIDGVFNNYTDNIGFANHCTQGAAMGMDGTTLIHPGQIEPANQAYCPSQHAVDNARLIVDAFKDEANHDKGVITLDGTMVERLHLEQATALLNKKKMIDERVFAGEPQEPGEP